MASITISSKSVEKTISIGQIIGSNLKGGEVVELLSDLGGGKTTLVKGIALGAGSRELVSSPSFTICNEYQAKGLKIYHYDFYRLNDAGIIRQALQEVMDRPGDVVVIEWPAVIEDTLIDKRVLIKLTVNKEDTRRTLEINYPPDFAYLTEGLK